MRRRSIPSFILGLVGSIFAFVGAYLYIAVFTFGAVFAKLIKFDDGGATEFYIFGSWLALAGAIVGVIGICFCFRKSRIGGIILLIAAAMIATIQIRITIDTMKVNGSFGFFSMFFNLLPSALILIAAIVGIIRKPEEKTKKIKSNNEIDSELI